MRDKNAYFIPVFSVLLLITIGLLLISLGTHIIFFVPAHDMKMCKDKYPETMEKQECFNSIPLSAYYFYGSMISLAGVIWIIAGIIDWKGKLKTKSPSFYRQPSAVNSEGIAPRFGFPNRHTVVS